MSQSLTHKPTEIPLDRQSLLTLGKFVLLVMGGGFLIGLTFTPGEWYAALNKPPFNPPSWVFGPAWTVIYLFIAIVGWRVHQRGDLRHLRGLWWTQLALNFLWTPAFFYLNMPWLAFAVIAPLLVSIVALLLRLAPTDRLSAALFVPYAGWVGFASVLNLSIAILN
ncbi:MAG: tryptophan-rich sensory protein [Donghicola eburneus]|nr:TspO/MBR family protein [Donghicola eburneus]MCI5039877.1 tryptophan-rich sensory protein [Donghicola eburneus]